MKKSRYLGQICFIVIGIIMAGGCYYDSVIFPEGGVTGDIQFTSDILPIFDKSCNTSGCHSPGGQKPDLSAANAYDALINGGYITSGAPEESELYLWMKGLKAAPMPPSGSDITNTAIVKAWIEQGAFNN